MLEETRLDPWDAGALPDEMVQTGVWRGFPVEITYRVPEDFEDCMNEVGPAGADVYYRSLMVGMRFGDGE